MKANSILSPKFTASLLVALMASLMTDAMAQNKEQKPSYQTIVAVKTNLLSDAFWTPSLSIEIPTISDHWTIDLTGEYNNWNAWDEQKWKHWTVQPEIRYWFSEAFNHWFLGAHFLGGEYNFGNLNNNLPSFCCELGDMRNYRYQGNFYGGGLGLGYAWQWSRHWGMSAELGLGYMRMNADKYDCAECEKLVEEDIHYNYVGPTKAALNLVYRFNKEKPAAIVEELEPVVIPTKPSIVPFYHFVRPVAEVVKDRSLEGQAFIEFEVNKTDIQPERANNRQELGKIIASIDSVRNNPDTKISELSIKGYASPDGPYEKNAVLAKGRTEQLSKYVKKLYNFDNKTITTSSEPEDWEGWRRLVDASDLPHRQEILDIMDNNKLTLDQKEMRIKKFENDYDMMRNDILMRLRHSDYVIKYTIRSYTTAEEIREVLKTRPSNLSLAEFYTAAEGYTEGTDEFNNIFLTAVQFYPNDPSANLNAANAYLSDGNMIQARRHLEKAGNTDEANYTRGLFNALNGHYEEALNFLKVPETAGMSAAKDLVNQINNILQWEENWGSNR